MSRKRRAGDPVLEPELPVTPMLDMAFQLLAFFVMTYHPSALEGQMELNLPATGEAKAQDQSQVDLKAQSDIEMEIPSEVTVVVSTQPSGPAQGMISQIQVQQREGNTTLGDLEALGAHLKKVQTAAGLKNKEDIKILADSRLKWAMVVQVVDTCQRAGFKGIGFGPPPDLAGGTP